MVMRYLVFVARSASRFQPPPGPEVYGHPGSASAPSSLAAYLEACLKRAIPGVVQGQLQDIPSR
eukprot:1826284-Lingulodinium_polyedra.AAC.1